MRRMIGRLLVCAVVVVAASVVWRSSSGGATNGRVACGVERWAVKTLQDRPLLRPARLTTVGFLVTRRPPAHLPARRLPFERNVFTVVAAVTGIRPEDDGDLHLLLRSGGAQMIAEAPQAVCTSSARLAYRRAMALARGLVRVCAHARITGVAFFDLTQPDRGRAERDRAAPDSRLPLPAGAMTAPTQ